MNNSSRFGENYFRKYSHDKGYSSHSTNPTYGKRLAEIKFLSPSKGHLLDIGCAYSYFLNQASQHGYKPIGTDISLFALKQSRKLFPKLPVFLSDSQHGIPLKASTIDTITLDNTLEHIPNYISIIAEIYRVLKKNGLLFICVPVNNRWTVDKTHLNYFTQKSLTTILKRYGFTVIKSGEEGGKFRNIFGLLRLFIKGHTLFNYVPRGSGSFLCIYAKK